MHGFTGMHFYCDKVIETRNRDGKV